MLRVADDLKDQETNKILFPDRLLENSDFPVFKKLNKELIHYSLFFCIKIYDKI